MNAFKNLRGTANVVADAGTASAEADDGGAVSAIPSARDFIKRPEPGPASTAAAPRKPRDEAPRAAERPSRGGEVKKRRDVMLPAHVHALISSETNNKADVIAHAVGHHGEAVARGAGARTGERGRELLRVSLLNSDWERVGTIAKRRGWSRSAVIAVALELHYQR